MGLPKAKKPVDVGYSVGPNWSIEPTAELVEYRVKTGVTFGRRRTMRRRLALLAQLTRREKRRLER